MLVRRCSDRKNVHLLTFLAKKPNVYGFINLTLSLNSLSLNKRVPPDGRAGGRSPPARESFSASTCLREGSAVYPRWAKLRPAQEAEGWRGGHGVVVELVQCRWPDERRRRCAPAIDLRPSPLLPREPPAHAPRGQSCEPSAIRPARVPYESLASRPPQRVSRTRSC